MPYFVAYTETSVASLFILALVYAKLLGGAFGTKEESSAFKRVVLSSVILAALDFIWRAGESGLIPFSGTANAALNFAYLSMTVLASCLWMVFSEIRLNKSGGKPHHGRALLFIPVAAFVLICFASLWTGWVFWIDGDGLYHRGSLYFVQVVLCCFYLLCPAARAVAVGLKEKNRARRHEAFILASFVVLPILSGVVQAFFFGVDFVNTGTALSILMVFINMQETQISLDALTGLNNRRRADEYLDTKLLSSPRGKHLYYLLADIDSFKQINDRFGHLEGDRALVRVGEALKSLCGRHDAFLARFGGDEFCFVLEAEKEEDLDQFLLDMTDSVSGAGKELPYPLSLSVGYAEYGWDGSPAHVLVSRADEMLYRNKEKAHAGR